MAKPAPRQLLVADVPGLGDAVLDCHAACAGLIVDGTLTGAHLALTRVVELLSPIAGASLETAMARTTFRPAALPRGGGDWGRRRPDGRTCSVFLTLRRSSAGSADSGVNTLALLPNRLMRDAVSATRKRHHANDGHLHQTNAP